jgi:hypothetical protein
MSNKVNLLQETLNELANNNLTSSNVEWVGSKCGKFKISWDDFVKIADIEYDNGFGGNEIASNLVVVGKDWWLSREEYDGSEWWRFNILPTQQEITQPFNCVLNKDYTDTISLSL